MHINSVYNTLERDISIELHAVGNQTLIYGDCYDDCKIQMQNDILVQNQVTLLIMQYHDFDTDVQFSDNF